MDAEAQIQASAQRLELLEQSLIEGFVSKQQAVRKERASTRAKAAVAAAAKSAKQNSGQQIAEIRDATKTGLKSLKQDLKTQKETLLEGQAVMEDLNEKVDGANIDAVDANK